MLKMAKQIDLYKAINKHAKAIKALGQQVDALNALSILAYSTEMNRYITRRLVKQWNRYLLWLKVKRFFGVKSAKAITNPIIVKSYIHD